MAMAYIHALGSNGSGQLGIGNEDDISLSQRIVANGLTTIAGVKNIVSGGNHTVTLFADGTVATAGANDDGRCWREPIGNAAASAQFLSVDMRHEGTATHIAATWSATFIVVDYSKIYVAGSGTSGELGLGPGITLSPTPQLLPDFPPVDTRVVSIAACMAHVVAVLSNGEVWGWGGGRRGQLGEPVGLVWSPRKIDEIAFAAAEVVCGKDFTCIFGPPSKGELLVLGLNRNDRFNVKAKAPSFVPDWKKVAASWGSVFVHKSDGALLAWGRDDHGQLPAVDLPHLHDFAAGSEHCIGLTLNGDVIAWGWGEHGNCGEPVDSNGDVKAKWNTIEASDTVSAVFAGCATSFYASRAIT